MVTGLVNSKFGFDRIALSPRNAAVAGALAALDERISVCASNQGVIDISDVVCIAVVPQIATEVLRDFHFTSRHQVISFVPGLLIDDLRKFGFPARREFEDAVNRSDRQRASSTPPSWHRLR